MVQPTHEETQNIRAKLGELVKKTASDQDFKAQMDADPVRVLRAAGISDVAISELLKESGSSSQVSGFDFDVPCWYTCWYYSSYCTVTRWWH
jgi:hypothetical protein